MQLASSASRGQSQDRHIREVEPVRIVLEAAQTAAESMAQLPTPSKLGLQSEVEQLAWRVGEPGEMVARMSQDCGCKVKDFLFARDGLQVQLNSMGSHI